MRNDFLTKVRTFFDAHSSSETGDDICLSRPASALTSRDAELKACVTADEKDEFARFARMHGYRSTSDCLRDLVLIATHGVEGVTNLHRERLAAIGRNLPGSRTEQTDTTSL